ncbi:bile acid:sodium symporter family protein [Niallia sp. Krafla_26]|uniref:bile acid:sodium symporter family protein n=1 Tax=Niallia sp. Krafla_26 TaxID=3064703 RepID=UPI003D17D071
MLQKINQRLNQLMPFITPTAVLVGITFSVYLKDFTFLVPWLFAFMTFEGSLSMNVRSFKSVITHPLPVFLILTFLHIIMPLWAWLVGHITFSDNPLTITGIIIAMIIPTGVTSFIWVSMKNGNKALTLAIILIDSLLSPIVVPFSLSVLVGQKVEIDVVSMMTGLLFMIVLPSILGMLLNELTKGKVNSLWKPRLTPISKLFLFLVVSLNGSVIAAHFQDFQISYLYIIVIVLFVSITGYLFAFLLGNLLKYNQEMLVSFTFSGGMRNISAGAVIAISYFPSTVVFPVVVGMLFQQIIASIFALVLDKHNEKVLANSETVSA